MVLIGTSSGFATATPTVSFEPPLQFDPGFDGYAPSVSIADGLIVLVGQGSGGALWYSIGVLQSSGQSIGIAWTTPKTYDSGFNHSVSWLAVPTVANLAALKPHGIWLRFIRHSTPRGRCGFEPRA